MTSPSPYMTMSDAADYIGVSLMTIRRWIDDGRLVAHRFGPRIIRIHRDQLDSLPARTDQK